MSSPYVQYRTVPEAQGFCKTYLTHEATLKLIDIVKKHEHLWNKHDERYESYGHNLVSWNEIITELFEKGFANADCAIDTWNNLYNAYFDSFESYDLSNNDREYIEAIDKFIAAGGEPEEIYQDISAEDFEKLPIIKKHFIKERSQAMSNQPSYIEPTLADWKPHQYYAPCPTSYAPRPSMYTWKYPVYAPQASPCPPDNLIYGPRDQIYDPRAVYPPRAPLHAPNATNSVPRASVYPSKAPVYNPRAGFTYGLTRSSHPAPEGSSTCSSAPSPTAYGNNLSSYSARKASVETLNASRAAVYNPTSPIYGMVHPANAAPNYAEWNSWSHSPAYTNRFPTPIPTSNLKDQEKQNLSQAEVKAAPIARYKIVAKQQRMTEDQKSRAQTLHGRLISEFMKLNKDETVWQNDGNKKNILDSLKLIYDRMGDILVRIRKHSQKGQYNVETDETVLLKMEKEIDEIEQDIETLLKTSEDAKRPHKTGNQSVVVSVNTTESSSNHSVLEKDAPVEDKATLQAATAPETPFFKEASKVPVYPPKVQASKAPVNALRAAVYNPTSPTYGLVHPANAAPNFYINGLPIQIPTSNLKDQEKQNLSKAEVKAAPIARYKIVAKQQRMAEDQKSRAQTLHERIISELLKLNKAETVWQNDGKKKLIYDKMGDILVRISERSQKGEYNVETEETVLLKMKIEIDKVEQDLERFLKMSEDAKRHHKTSNQRVVVPVNTMESSSNHSVLEKDAPAQDQATSQASTAPETSEILSSIEANQVLSKVIERSRRLIESKEDNAQENESAVKPPVKVQTESKKSDSATLEKHVEPETLTEASNASDATKNDKIQKDNDSSTDDFQAKRIEAFKEKLHEYSLKLINKTALPMDLDIGLLELEKEMESLKKREAQLQNNIDDDKEDEVAGFEPTNDIAHTDFTTISPAVEAKVNATQPLAAAEAAATVAPVTAPEQVTEIARTKKTENTSVNGSDLTTTQHFVIHIVSMFIVMFFYQYFMN